MPSIKRERGGRIAGLFVGSRKGQAKKAVSRVFLTIDGIGSDAHSGRTTATGPRQRVFTRETSIANTRQFSLVSVEELEAIALASVFHISIPRG